MSSIWKLVRLLLSSGNWFLYDPICLPQTSNGRPYGLTGQLRRACAPWQWFNQGSHGELAWPSTNAGNMRWSAYFQNQLRIHRVQPVFNGFERYQVTKYYLRFWWKVTWLLKQVSLGKQRCFVILIASYVVLLAALVKCRNVLCLMPTCEATWRTGQVTAQYIIGESASNVFFGQFSFWKQL